MKVFRPIAWIKYSVLFVYYMVRGESIEGIRKIISFEPVDLQLVKKLIKIAD
ncbi:MAG: hypothetical protein WDN26_18405 [Chitinophagaceae bacterium]